MSPIEILKVLTERPFQPLRLHLSDGRTFDVKHPDAAFPTKNAIYLATGHDPATGEVTQREVVGMLHVTSVTQFRTLAALAA